MNIKFYDFLKSVNAFNGAETKNHNTLFTYSTLFALQKISIMNCKMIKIQLRFLLILLHNLLLKKNELTLTNFDRRFSDLLDLTNLNAYLPLNIASKWFFASSSNFSSACLSDRFLYQQVFSALLKPFILFNIGNIEHFRPNHFVSRNRLLLFSSVNTDARITDFQYYFVLNTASRSLMNFIIQFFFNIIKKFLYLDMVFSHNNLLRYRYWFAIYHMFNKRYVRRSVVMSGLLARGLLVYCTQKLHKSYSRITLFNLYCSHFPITLVKDSFSAKIASNDLKLGHDTRFLKKLRFPKFQRFFRKYTRHSFFQIRLNPLRFYFKELFRRRLMIKRHVYSTASKYRQYTNKKMRAGRLFEYADRFFLGLPVARYKSYRRILNRVFLQDRFRPLRSLREYTRFAYIKLFFQKLKKLRRLRRSAKRKLTRRLVKRFVASSVWPDFISHNPAHSVSEPDLINQILPYHTFSTYYRKNSKWVLRRPYLKEQLRRRLNFNFDSRQIWFRFFTFIANKLHLSRIVKLIKRRHFKQKINKKIQLKIKQKIKQKIQLKINKKINKKVNKKIKQKIKQKIQLKINKKINKKVNKKVNKFNEKTISKNKKRFKI